ncbi:MAG: LuxR C-terminal-related transcriptional regulator [Paracoccaceae bacterium]
MLDQTREHYRGKAIISDDDEFFRVALSTVLSDRNGFADVIVTSSLQEATDRLGTAGTVEIGLFDLNMLGMDNWHDLSALRDKFPDMRLVVVSASRLREDILMALEIGAHGFIHKGLGICELSRAIDLICDGQVYVPPFLPQHCSVAPDDDVLSADFADPPSPNEAQTASGNAGSLRCSPRQREVIDLLIAGHSNKSMARVLNLSEGTIKFHMSAVMRLLGVNGRVEAATRAMKHLHG